MVENNEQIFNNMAPEHIPVPNKPDDTDSVQISELLSITGKTNVNEALASVAALKMQAEEFRAMHEKINRLENNKPKYLINQVSNKIVAHNHLS